MLVVGYFGLVGAAFAWDAAPGVLWTMALPALPIALVIMGFYRWRAICPLAAIGSLGARVPRTAQRRVPAWLERGFFGLTFVFLLFMLTLRHVATNGDGYWLGALLLGLAALAIVANAVFTGKTWCNFFCPVGFVERVYTEPASLGQVEPTSRCVRCTACKKNCPDIDQENAYWRDVLSGSRWMTVYAFPGLVLGFYVYYWLRAGDWQAYFGGEWTRHASDSALWFGPGFFFAPGVPAVFASLLTLLGFSVASLVVFKGIEWVAVLVGGGDKAERRERARHHVLALSAFAAFLAFYAFAGAPSLMRVPGGVRILALVAPVVATLFIVRRWGRSRVDYLQLRSVRNLVKRWRFDEPPPATPAGVVAFVRAHEQSRNDQVEAYARTVREVIADGIVTLDERRLLDRLRVSLDVDERTHRKILVDLGDEARELLEGEAVGPERRLQLEGYRRALSQALLEGASNAAQDALRADWGVDLPTHRRLVATLQSAGGPLQAAALRDLARIEAYRADLRVLGPMPPLAPFTFLVYVLLKRQDRLVDRVVEALALCATDSQRVRDGAPDLFSGDKRVRRRALDALRQRTDPSLVEALAPIVENRMPKAREGEVADVRQVLEHLAVAESPWLRAGALMAAAEARHPALPRLLASGLADAHPVVREEAVALETARSLGRPRSAREVDAPATGRYAAHAVPDAPFDALTIVDRMLFLRCVSLFVDLEPEDLYSLAEAAVELRIGPGAVFCREGERGGALQVIVAGDAQASVTVGQGSVDAAHLGPGEPVGELAVLDQSPQNVDVRAGEAGVRLLAIPQERCRGLLLTGRLAPAVVATLARRLRETHARLGAA